MLKRISKAGLGQVTKQFVNAMIKYDQVPPGASITQHGYLKKLQRCITASLNSFVWKAVLFNSIYANPVFTLFFLPEFYF
jgi:hypothetical protein